MRRPHPTLSRLSAEPPGVAARRGDEGRSVSRLFHLPCSAPGAGSAPKSNSPWRAPPLASVAGPATGRRAARAMVRNETTLLGGSLSSPVSEPQGPRRWWAPGTGARPLASHGRAARWTPWPPRTFRTRRGGLERAPVTCGRGRVATPAPRAFGRWVGAAGAPFLPAVLHPAAVAGRG